MPNKNEKIIYPQLGYVINGILYDAHNELNRYCNEGQVCDRIEWHLKQKGIFYQREISLDPSFDGEHRRRNRIDFIIDGKILLGIKCVDYLIKDHYFQVQRYLHARDFHLGFLVNFREKRIRPHRIINPDYNSIME